MYTRFVEIGRVGLVNFGPDYGQLVTIIDVLDDNRVLIDSTTDVVGRQVMNLKRITLTDLKVKIQRQARYVAV